jgi:hypothetical protein
LFPFNPDRVLRDIQKPLEKLTLSRADEVNMGSNVQDEVLQTPITPATPVTAEALLSLRGLIEQDAHKVDEASKQRLQRRLQKFSNAAQIFLAERTLLQDENQLLFKQNNEAKVRRSTKSTVIGKAKVMSWEDIEEAREKRAAKEQAAADKRDRGQQKRAAKEQATTDKGKRARKRKDAAPEVTEPKAKMARISEAPEAEAEAVRVPAVWISEEQVAPVARMY